jgi:hypothetical protein
MLSNLLNAILPVVLIIACGYFSRKKKLLPSEATVYLIEFILKFTFPVLIFYDFSTTDIINVWDTEFAIIIIIAAVLTFVFAYLINRIILKRSSKVASIAGMACSWPNNVFMGIPILYFLFGKEAVTSTFIATVLIMFTMFPISMAMLEKDQTVKGHFLLKIGLHKNPLVIASVLGVLFSVFNIHLNDGINRGLSLLSVPTITIALFTAGMTIADSKIHVGKDVLLNVLLKNIFQPLLGLLLVFLFGMDGFWAAMVILNLACPTANTPGMYAIRYGCYKLEASNSILVTSVCYVFTIFVFYSIAIHYAVPVMNPVSI